MADDTTTTPSDESGAAKEPDYKAMWEEAKAEAERWKANSRKNEGRAKTNAAAAKGLEEANKQLTDLSERISAIEGENAALKASAARAEVVAKVARETGVPEAIVASLAGEDEKGLRQAASAIAEAYKVPGGAPAAPEAGKLPSTGGSAKTASQKFADTIDELLG